MRKYLHILSAVMLMVYGTLALVFVPLHHHSDENLSALKLHNFSSVQVSGEKSTIKISSKDCDVCLFSHVTIILHASVSAFSFESTEEHQCVLISESQALEFLTSHPHRGPPVFHS